MHKNRTAVLFSLVCLALVAVAGYFFVHWANQFVDIAFAEDKTRILEKMTRDARDKTVPGAVRILDSLVTDYPKWTKQSKDSKLNQIVERSRASAIREIVAVLRIKADKDLGDDPAVWIRTYKDSRDSPPIALRE